MIIRDFGIIDVGVFDFGDYVMRELQGKVLKKQVTLIPDFSKREIFRWGMRGP